MKRKEWTWATHVMRRRDNIWAVRVTEWQPRDGKGRPNKQRIRWIIKIQSFVGIT